MNKCFKKNINIILLNVAVLIYSIAGIFSKKAGLSDMLSLKFFLYYGISIFLLVLYAIIWQQAIKKIPLSLAYINKAFAILWGLIFSNIIFGEKITLGKIIGVIIVICGIIFFVLGNNKEDN